MRSRMPSATMERLLGTKSRRPAGAKSIIRLQIWHPEPLQKTKSRNSSGNPLLAIANVLANGECKIQFGDRCTKMQQSNPATTLRRPEFPRFAGSSLWRQQINVALRDSGE